MDFKEYVDPELKGPTGPSKAHKPGNPAFVRAKVINVNIREFSVDVQTESDYRVLDGLIFLTPYCHQEQGEGINYMPEVGSTCWVCLPDGTEKSDTNTNAFVVGWMPASEEGSYRGGRVLLNPGDIHYSTRDGNFIILRRGGIIQISSTPACQRLYIPIRNSIRDYCENYELRTPGGDLTWFVDREDTNSEGHKECTFTLACKEFADDPNDKPAATIKLGSHQATGDTILSIATTEEKTALTISKTGEVTWKLEKLSITATQTVDITAATINMVGSAAVNLSAPAISMSAGGGAKCSLGESAVIDGNEVKLGGGASPIVLQPGLQAWMDQVTAAINTLAPGAVTPAVGHVASKVKAT